MLQHKTLFLLTALLLITSTSVFAQWEPDRRLTNTSGSSFINNNNAWYIAASGDTIHVIYNDDQNGAFQVYYTSSYNAGLDWNTPIILSQVISNIWDYALAVSGSTVHVIWANNMENRFLYRRSINAGATWSQEDTILVTTANFIMPCIAANGNNVYLVWGDTRHPINNIEVYFMSSNDAGLNWSTPQRLTNTGNAIGDNVPSIAVSGNFLHLVWGRVRSSDLYRRTLYLRSTNYGATWEPERFLTSDTIYQFQPVVAVAGSNVHVTWEDQRIGQNQIYYRMSSDNGANWQQETYLTGATYNADYQTMCVIGNNIHVAWRDFGTIPWHIGYRNSTNNGLTWQPNIILTPNSFTQEGPSIAAAGSKVHLIWYDNRDGNWEIYYKRNPTGSGIEEDKRSPLTAHRLSLEIYPNPTNIFLIVRCPSPAEIKIYDVTGKAVKEVSSNIKETRISLDGIKNGIYFAQVDNLIAKFIVTK